jgi:predicted nucleic acid-binding Zn ribbon protein
MVNYTIEKNESSSDAHGHDVWNYYCKTCGNRIDCNDRFDKTPEADFCSGCGAKV